MATGTPSSNADEGRVRSGGGVPLALTLKSRFPTEKDPPSDACNTKRLLLVADHIPKMVKTPCHSSGCLMKTALAADPRVHAG
jgi:hypothetical protein